MTFNSLRYVWFISSKEESEWEYSAESVVVQCAVCTNVCYALYKNKHCNVMQ